MDRIGCARANGGFERARGWTDDRVERRKEGKDGRAPETTTRVARDAEVEGTNEMARERNETKTDASAVLHIYFM